MFDQMGRTPNEAKQLGKVKRLIARWDALNRSLAQAADKTEVPREHAVIVLGRGDG